MLSTSVSPFPTCHCYANYWKTTFWMYFRISLCLVNMSYPLFKREHHVCSTFLQHYATNRGQHWDPVFTGMFLSASFFPLFEALPYSNRSFELISSLSNEPHGVLIHKNIKLRTGFNVKLTSCSLCLTIWIYGRFGTENSHYPTWKASILPLLL